VLQRVVLLMQESCRFTDSALRAVTALGKCLTNFSDPVKYQQAADEFKACHCPLASSCAKTKQKHRQVFYKLRIGIPLIL
jgi:hypothetical protein